MIVIKPGNYRPALEGTCPRCGQVERFDLSETDEENNKSCTLCGYFMNITNKPEPIDKPEPSFKDELTHLINKHSIENIADMPDFMLADMLCKILEAIGPFIKDCIMQAQDSKESEPIDRPSALEPFDVRRKK